MELCKATAYIIALGGVVFVLVAKGHELGEAGIGVGGTVGVQAHSEYMILMHGLCL